MPFSFASSPLSESLEQASDDQFIIHALVVVTADENKLGKLSVVEIVPQIPQYWALN